MTAATPIRALAVLAILSLAPAANSAVLRVAVQASVDENIRVYDGSSASAAYADTSTGVGIQAGSVTADTAANRAYFIGNVGSVQSLYRLDYTTTNIAAAQALTGVLRVTHLEWDASGTTRLLGVGFDPSDASVSLLALNGTTVLDLGMPTADCCTFRIGVSAFRSSDDSLFLVGRRSIDTQDQLFRFTMNPPTLAQAVAIPVDLSIGEIAIDAGGSLNGLAYSSAAAATLLFTSNSALTITTLGSGISDCCFMLAGASAIDASASRLYTVGADIINSPANQPRLWSFVLGSGAINDGVTPVNAAGLFVDGTPILSNNVLFLDGFE